MRVGHLAVPQAQGKQTRTPDGGTACPDPDASHRPRRHRPGRAAPRLRTTSRGAGRGGEEEQGGPSPGATRSSGGTAGSMGVEERGARGPGIPSAGAGRAAPNGAGATVRGRPPRSPRAGALVRVPATPCRRSRAASVDATTAKASGAAGRKARRKRRLRPPARPPLLATPTSAVRPRDSSAAVPGDGNRALRLLLTRLAPVFKFRRPDRGVLTSRRCFAPPPVTADSQ